MQGSTSATTLLDAHAWERQIQFFQRFDSGSYSCASLLYFHLPLPFLVLALQASMTKEMRSSVETQYNFVDSCRTDLQWSVKCFAAHDWSALEGIINTAPNGWEPSHPYEYNVIVLCSHLAVAAYPCWMHQVSPTRLKQKKPLSFTVT